MHGLDHVLSSTRQGPGRFACEIPDGWQAGRGTFGGLVAGLLARAVGDEVPAPLRSITVEIPAPVTPGPAGISVDVVRTGSTVTLATARLEQDGEVRALATAACGGDRGGEAAVRWRTVAAPTTPAWRDVAALPFVAGVSPPFLRHADLRLVGPMPFSRAAEASILGWVGFREPATRLDAAWVAAHADAYWPAALAVFRGPRPTATLTFTLELVEPTDDLDPTAPVLIAATSPAAQAGYAFETRLVWGADGRLLARNHQTFVIIK